MTFTIRRFLITPSQTVITLLVVNVVHVFFCILSSRYTALSLKRNNHATWSCFVIILCLNSKNIFIYLATETRRLNLRVTRVSSNDMNLIWNDMSWSKPMKESKYLTTNRSCTILIRSKMLYPQPIETRITLAPGRTNCTLTGLTEGVYYWVQLTCTGVVGTEKFSDIDGLYITTPFSGMLLAG